MDAGVTPPCSAASRAAMRSSTDTRAAAAALLAAIACRTFSMVCVGVGANSTEQHSVCRENQANAAGLWPLAAAVGVRPGWVDLVQIVRRASVQAGYSCTHTRMSMHCSLAVVPSGVLQRRSEGWSPSSAGLHSGHPTHHLLVRVGEHQRLASDALVHAQRILCHALEVR